MPTQRKPPVCSPLRPWHARVKRDNIEWSLGYWATREEAIVAEQSFTLPSRKGSNQYVRKEHSNA